MSGRAPVLQSLRLALAALALTTLAGCSWLSGGRAFAPEGFTATHDAGRLTDPATLSDAYRDLFPDLSSLQFNQAKLTASRRWIPGTEIYTFWYGAAGPETVRMRGKRPNTAFGFDLLEAQGRMIVVVNTGQTMVFAGAVPPGGSPVREVFGVEPGDLWRIFTIGQRIWHERWTARTHWHTVELHPAEPAADGLTQITLDRKTGLPRSATWQRGDRAWTVTFDAWRIFTGGRRESGATPEVPAPGQTRLMPGQIEVEPDIPPTRLVLSMQEPDFEYRFGSDSAPTLFTPPRIGGNRVLPLERLKDALGAP